MSEKSGGVDQTARPALAAGLASQAEMATSPIPTIRLRLDISYNGTDFAGWAIQPGLRTVAGTLDAALQTLLRGPVPMVVAGRTDAGVHAAGQVAHIDVVPERLLHLTPRHTRGPVIAPEAALAQACTGLLRRLAGLLPPDVRVRAVAPAADGFDARFAALRRHYRYRIGTCEWGIDPLDGVGVLRYGRALDTSLMQRAAAALIGLHDFAAYCRPRSSSDGRAFSTVRELQRISVTRLEREVFLDVTADAFCHSMVRSLVGMLIRVGEAREPVTAPAQLLAARVRSSRVSTAPAAGLTLLRVDYPADDLLLERSREARSVREALPPTSARPPA